MTAARDSRRENVVREAAQALREHLQNFARLNDELAYGSVEPRGDYFINESDPTSRGKVVSIDFGQGDFRFEGFVGLGERGWEGSYQVRQRHGPTVSDFGRAKTFGHRDEAIRFVHAGYKSAWSRFYGAKRDPAPRRIRPTRAEQDWISAKIRTLRHEGYPQRQAQAIAYRMAADRRSRSRSRSRR